MIIKKQYLKKIPSFRHKTDIRLFDNIFFFNKNYKKKKYLFNKNLIKRRKNLNKFKSFNIFSNVFRYTSFIIKTLMYNTKPYKKFFLIEDIFKNKYTLPGIEKLNVGNIYHPIKIFSQTYKKFLFKGLPIYLEHIPYNINFSNITNFITKKITFAKAAGTFCKIKKLHKNKKKLILIELPSKKQIYLIKKSIAYIGKNQNYFINKLIDGKFGFTHYNFKKIAVRGVAMNPIDHPNGGRAKTVQPEKSP